MHRLRVVCYKWCGQYCGGILFLEWLFHPTALMINPCCHFLIVDPLILVICLLCLTSWMRCVPHRSPGLHPSPPWRLPAGRGSCDPAPGETVCVVGSAPQLGSWSLEGAVELMKAGTPPNLPSVNGADGTSRGSANELHDRNAETEA